MAKRTRGLILILAFALIGMGSWSILAPNALRAATEEPCDFSDLGPCIPDMQHVFENSCEGVDCYTALEFCCLGPIIVEPN